MYSSGCPTCSCSAYCSILFNLDRARKRTPPATEAERAAQVLPAQVMQASISRGPQVAAMKAVQVM
jgi:hypothetical protein